MIVSSSKSSAAENHCLASATAPRLCLRHRMQEVVAGPPQRLISPDDSRPEAMLLATEHPDSTPGVVEVQANSCSVFPLIPVRSGKKEAPDEPMGHLPSPEDGPQQLEMASHWPPESYLGWLKQGSASLRTRLSHLLQGPASARFAELYKESFANGLESPRILARSPLCRANPSSNTNR